MKNPISKLSKAFENRIRLGIMSMLMVESWVDFKTLKETLELTDGNLATHLMGLEKKNFIEVQKSFIGKKPHTSYRATMNGKKAFNDHLNALEEILRGMN